MCGTNGATVVAALAGRCAPTVRLSHYDVKFDRGATLAVIVIFMHIQPYNVEASVVAVAAVAIQSEKE